MNKTRKLFKTVTLMLVMAIMLTTSAFAASVEATVNTHMLNVREGKGMQYTIIDVLYEGNTVKVVKDDGSGWVKVKVNGQTGWVNKLFLTFKEELPKAEEVTVTKEVTAPAQTATQGGSTNGKVTGDGVYMRSGPSTESSILDTLSKGTKVTVNGACGNWYEVSCGGMTGYIHSKYVKVKSGVTVAAVEAPAGSDATATQEVTAPPETQVPEPTPAPTPKATATPKPTSKPKATATPKPTATPAGGTVTGQTIVDTAMKYIGIPYVWAGTSPEEGFDCSGLVYYCFKVNGITINRVAQSMYYNGKAVDLEKLKPGDILLFGSSVYNIWHAGIYVGNGQFIHSPHSGANVRVENLADQYGLRLVAARRVTKK